MEVVNNCEKVAYYTWKNGDKYYKKLCGGEVVIHVDYSENFKNKQQTKSKLDIMAKVNLFIHRSCLHKRGRCCMQELCSGNSGK